LENFRQMVGTYLSDASRVMLYDCSLSFGLNFFYFVHIIRDEANLQCMAGAKGLRHIWP
jgi:hypothetical protein